MTPIRHVGRRGTAKKLRRWLPRALAVAVAAVALSGCNNTFVRLGFPPPISKQAGVILTLWQGSWLAGGIVFFVVAGLILWAVVFHRKRSNRMPAQVRYNMPIEILYTTLPFIMIAVLFYFTARDENYVNNLKPHPDVTVNVLGYQWSWQFTYPHYHVVDRGQMYPGPLPLVEVPEHEKVRFNLTSQDVVHSFWVPQMLFKRQVIPNYPNHFQVTFNRTGTFTGHCAELCGIYHSRMLFTMKVVTPAQFRTWVASRQHQEGVTTVSTVTTRSGK